MGASGEVQGSREGSRMSSGFSTKSFSMEVPFHEGRGMEREGGAVCVGGRDPAIPFGFVEAGGK